MGGLGALGSTGSYSNIQSNQASAGGTAMNSLAGLGSFAGLGNLLGNTALGALGGALPVGGSSTGALGNQYGLNSAMTTGYGGGSQLGSRGNVSHSDRGNSDVGEGTYTSSSSSNSSKVFVKNVSIQRAVW